MDDRLIARSSRVIFAAMLFREQGLKKFSTPPVGSLLNNLARNAV